MFGGGQVADEHADAAGIDGGDQFEIQDDAILSLTEKFGHGGVEAIERGAHGQAPVQLDQLHSVDGFGLNLQGAHFLGR